MTIKVAGLRISVGSFLARKPPITTEVHPNTEYQKGFSPAGIARNSSHQTPQPSRYRRSTDRSLAFDRIAFVVEMLPDIVPSLLFLVSSHSAGTDRC
jgi:hypothetical protein